MLNFFKNDLKGISELWRFEIIFFIFKNMMIEIMINTLCIRDFRQIELKYRLLMII